jgi:hypothetical protein
MMWLKDDKHSLQAAACIAVNPMGNTTFPPSARQLHYYLPGTPSVKRVKGATAEVCGIVPPLVRPTRIAVRKLQIVGEAIPTAVQVIQAAAGTQTQDMETYIQTVVT